MAVSGYCGDYVVCLSSVCRDARICGHTQPSDAESVEIRISLMSKYGFHVKTNMQTGLQLMVLIVNLMKKLVISY